jgi:hypothetical protein
VRSESAIAAGIELGFADSGEVLYRGMADSGRFRPPLSDSFLRDVLGVKTELQGWSARLMVASSNGDELDWARVSVTYRDGREREEEWHPRVSSWRWMNLYRPRKAAAFIESVHEAAANRAPGSSPPSCLLTRG